MYLVYRIQWSIALIETIVVNYDSYFEPLVEQEYLLIFLEETATRLHSESDKSHSKCNILFI